MDKGRLSRKERRESEKGINPFKEMMKVIKPFFLIKADTRHQSYVDYEA